MSKTTHELARELLEMEEVHRGSVLYLSCGNDEEWED